MKKQLAEVKESWLRIGMRNNSIVAQLVPVSRGPATCPRESCLSSGTANFLRKTRGAKIEMRSVGVAFSEGVAFDTGAHTQVENEKRGERTILWYSGIFSQRPSG
jgi:hypothetical protein